MIKKVTAILGDNDSQIVAMAAILNKNIHTEDFWDFGSKYQVGNQLPFFLKFSVFFIFSSWTLKLLGHKLI